MSLINSGLFLAIDGPNGVGKSTICKSIAEYWSSLNRNVCIITEPSSSSIGSLVKSFREMPEHALTLSCLVVADRYRNMIEEIRPKKANGYLVISDRYVPSTLVYQRIHGLPEQFLINLNSFADKPDLTVIVDADLSTLKSRIIARKSNSYSENVSLLTKEVKLYASIGAVLEDLGYPIMHVQNDAECVNKAVAIIVNKLKELYQGDGM
jgi:dTMP kinase